MKRSILVVSPHPLYRQGIKIALRRHRNMSLYSIHEADSFSVQQIPERIDLIILSAQLLKRVHLPAIRHLIGMLQVPVLVISDLPDRQQLHKAHHVGASGLISARVELTEIARASKQIMEGKAHWPSKFEGCGSAYVANSRSRLLTPRLSQRQGQVLGLLKDGLSNKQIGYLMNISESTVKSHMSVLLRKFEATTRTELISKALV